MVENKVHGPKSFGSHWLEEVRKHEYSSSLRTAATSVTEPAVCDAEDLSNEAAAKQIDSSAH